jgi:hypothetical protein
MEPATLSWSVLAIAATGFFFLLGLIAKIIEGSIVKELKEIKLALVGDLERPGVITKIHDHDKELKMIKDVCKEKHERLEHARV